jgi:hypothetical protein
MARKCFVISPIGPEGSEVREHADDVFDFIIEPAAKLAEYQAHRGDHSSKSGKITEQMFGSILRDTFVIAVLTYHNPNVFYELAVAQAAARPVILLIAKDTPLPFDIKDLRVIFYDLRPRSIKKDVYVDALYKAIKELEAGGMKGEVPFRPSLSPLGSASKGFEILDRSSDLGSEDYLKFIRDSRQSLMLSGFSLFFSWHTTEFESALREKSNSGCAIRVLIMHEDNPAVGSMLNSQIGSHYEHAVNFIKSSMQKWSGLAATMPTLELRKVRTGIIYHRLTINEEEALITPHLYSVASTADCPLIRVPNSSVLYARMTGEFERLWADNAEHSNRRESNLTLLGSAMAANR